MTASKAKGLANEINKLMGKDVLVMGNDPRFTLEHVPTGVLPLDVLLGGGIPRGRITEVYGDWSTLKSWVALKLVANVQMHGGTAALVDTERTFDSAWAAQNGVDVANLLLQRPANGEEAVDVTDALVRSGDLDVIVWDSVASTLPRDEASHMESSDKFVQPARLAALMSRGLRKLVTGNERTALFFTNQTRMNIGVSFGNPEITSGGKAMGFYASVRINLRKAGKETLPIQVGSKKLTMVVGQKVRATLDKSKINAPHRDTIFTYDMRIPGVDDAEWITSHGLEHGYIFNSGKSWWCDWQDTEVVTHRSRWITYLNDPEQEWLLDTLRQYARQVGP